MTESPEPHDDERDDDTAGHLTSRGDGSQNPLRDPTAPKSEDSADGDTVEQPPA